MVEALDEWLFEFEITAPAPIRRADIDTLLDEMIAWAEAHTLGIGGGYRPMMPEVAAAATAWRFEFGLCNRQGMSLIPASQAAELRELVRGLCYSHGLSFAGGFRAFTPEP